MCVGGWGVERQPVAVQNLGKCGNMSQLHRALSNGYRTSTYRVSVFHEICKTKENMVVVKEANSRWVFHLGTSGLGAGKGGPQGPGRGYETHRLTLFRWPGTLPSQLIS